MHDRQYRDYKSGIAKKRFNDELQRAKEAALAKQGFSEEDVKKYKRAQAEPIMAPESGRLLWEIDVVEHSAAPTVGKKYWPEDTFCYLTTPWNTHDAVQANFKGRIIEICHQQGDLVKKGDVLAYIQKEE